MAPRASRSTQRAAGLKHELQVSPFAISTATELKHLPVDDDFLAIDFGYQQGELAIDNNDPSHYLHNGTENGVTTARRRMLKTLGWNTGSIQKQSWEYAKRIEDPRQKIEIGESQLAIKQSRSSAANFKTTRWTAFVVKLTISLNFTRFARVI